MELAVDETSIGLVCHPRSINTTMFRQFTCVRVWKCSWILPVAQHPKGGRSLLLQGQLGPGLEPRPCLMQSEDFGDTEWILHPLCWERVAEVGSFMLYCRLNLKLVCAVFVFRWTAGWTKERLPPSGFQIILTTAIYVAANL